MFVLSLVFLAVLASSAAQAAFTGIPRYMQGQWIISDENLQDEDTDGQFLSVKEKVWPQSPAEVAEVVTVKELTLLATPQSQAMGEQDSNEGEDSTAWKIFLVVAILLVSAVGSLSLAYYMCVWRGGRIFYKPHKEDFA